MNLSLAELNVRFRYLLDDASPFPDRGSLINGNGESILVVDDDAISRILIKNMLSSHGYRVFLAENGRDALDVYLRTASEISLVITDKEMPEIGGIDLAITLREYNPYLGIIIISGDDEQEKVDEPVLFDVPYVVKPIKIDFLLSLVSRIIND